MNLVGQKRLIDFQKNHPDCRQGLSYLSKKIKNSRYKNIHEFMNAFPAKTRALSKTRVLYNFKGNHYRIVFEINFNVEVVTVKFIGTHSEYDKVNPFAI